MSRFEQAIDKYDNMDKEEMAIFQTALARLYSQYSHLKIDRDVNKLSIWDRVTMDEFNLNVSLSAKYKSSKKGTQVQSLGEIMIAEYLEKKGIKYKYDKRYYLRKIKGKKEKLKRPDFRLHGIKHMIIIEYFGMIDNKGYREKTKTKIEDYDKQEVYKLVDVYPLDLVSGFTRNQLEFESFLDEQINEKKPRTAFIGLMRKLFY